MSGPKAGEIRNLQSQLDELKQKAEILAAQLDAADQFSIGICAALNDVLQVTSEHCPEIIRGLEPRYREGRLLYKRAEAGAIGHVVPENYQPMSMLYALLDSGGAFERAGL